MTRFLSLRNIFPLGLLILLSCTAAAGQPTTQGQVIANHTKAMGGNEAIEAIQRIEISLRIEEPTFQVDAVYIADRQLRMRIDIYSQGKRVYTEAYDGEKAWQQSGEGEPPQDSSEKGTAALWHGVAQKMFGLHETESQGSRLSLEGRELVEGVNYYVLKLTFKDGFEKHLYIHPETWLVERQRDTRALHPDMDPSIKWIENRAYDFRRVDGVMRSFRSTQVDLKTGEVLQTTMVKTIRSNIPIDPAIFKKPE